MLKKILIIVAVIIVILLIGNYILSRFASDLVETELRSAFQQEQANRFDLDFESANVNTLSSTITLKNVHFLDKTDSSRYSSDSFSLNLSLSDIIKSARNRNENVDISEAQFRINNFVYRNSDGVQGLQAGHIHIDLNGDINNLMRSFQAGRAPSQNQQIKADFTNLRVTQSVAITETVAYDEITTFNRIQSTFLFSDVNNSVIVESLSIQTPQANATISGEVTNFNDVSIRNANFGAEITLLNEFLPVGEDGAKLEFDTLELRYNGPLESLMGIPSLVSAERGTLEANLKTVVLTPPETYQQSIGQSLDALGVPTDRIFLPTITSNIQFRGPTLTVHAIDIDTGFGMVKVLGDLNVDTVQPALSTWKDGAVIQIRPQSPEIRQFINSMAGFMGIPLQREEYGFSVGLSGTLTSPFIPGLNRL